jgi:hypothetical protein
VLIAIPEWKEEQIIFITRTILFHIKLPKNSREFNELTRRENESAACGNNLYKISVGNKKVRAYSRNLNGLGAFFSDLGDQPHSLLVPG